jgi:hypothetical protein
MAFNVKLFDKMVAHVVAVPDRLAMEWSVTVADKNGIVQDYIVGTYNPKTSNYKQVALHPPCKTAGCAAGWTVLLGEPGRFRDKVKKWGDVAWTDVSEAAAYLLGLERSILEDKFFHVDDWPEPYKSKWKKARKPSDRVAIFAERAAQFRAWALEEEL